MHMLKRFTLAMAVILLFCGHSFATTDAQTQWQSLTQSGLTPAAIISQLLAGGTDLSEVASLAVTAGAIQDLLTVTKETESMSMIDTVAAILDAGGVAELVKLMTPREQLEEIVIAAIDGGSASPVFTAAIQEVSVVQEQLYVAAIENEATCLMAEALMTTGTAMEVAVTQLMQMGADAQVIGTCFGENVPGLGYTKREGAAPARQPFGPQPKRASATQPVSAGS